MTLTTRWGWYAWQNVMSFDIDNHLVICHPFYRGRPISNLNIQVSKYNKQKKKLVSAILLMFDSVY